MSTSNTNTATSSDNVATWFFNVLVYGTISALEATAIMLSLVYGPNIIYKTICSKSKPLPILSYVCKQIEEFLKPSEEPRSPIVVIPTEEIRFD